MSLLEVDGVEVFFDLSTGELHAVQGVDLTLDPGERLGIVGESGSGKTTTVLALMGLLPPNASVAGEVRLDGQNLLDGGERGSDSWRWREIATVFQGAMNALNPIRTVGWQISEPMKVHGTAVGAAARARTRELLSLVGLSPAIENSYPHELSGGMRQRAAIAMALACEPKVLLADEPTTALDVVVQAGILELLARLTDDLGLALLLVTHDLATVMATCTRLAVMYAGRVVEEGTVVDMANGPAHPYTRLLFAAIPDLLDRRPVRSIPGVPPRLDQSITGCPFAPRCDVSFAACLEERPALRVVGDGRKSACYRPPEWMPGEWMPGEWMPADEDATSRSQRTPRLVAAGPFSAAPTTEGAGMPEGVAIPNGTPVPFDDRGSGPRSGQALELDGVSVWFSRRRKMTDLVRSRATKVVRAVDGISLDLGAGEMVAIVGESGSGKTSTAQAIIGNVPTAHGRVVVAGRVMADMDRAAMRQLRRQVQLVYQDPYESLDPRMRVRSILDEPLRVNGIGRGRRERAELSSRALREVGLDPPELFLARFPHELSGGQRQRVAVAAALVMEPAVLVADEPVSMLDVSVRADVLEILDTMRRVRSVAVLMITHDLSTAAHYADRIVVMYLGRIVEEGPADEIVRHPRHPYTQALVAAVPGARKQLSDPIMLIGGEIPDASAIPSGCRFHPRCPLALATCAEDDPELVTIGNQHAVACVLVR